MAELNPATKRRGRYDAGRMWSAPPSGRLRPRVAWGLLALILLTGLALRGWYSSYGLDAARFWDERYAQRNVFSILHDGTLKPASSYYPSPLFNLPAAALIAASERLHEATGRKLFDAARGRSLRSSGYFLLRFLQSLYGVGAVLVLFLLGRALFSPGVGLVAALILAFMPWQIHASGYFKPDALLVFAVLLALYWSVRLIQRPAWGRALLAGLGVALAASAKLTGVLTAVPLAAGLLLLAGRESRRLLHLFIAGVSAAVAFAVINPYWRSYLVWVESLKQDYGMRAEWLDMTRAQILPRTWEFLADRFTLGLIGSVLAVAGLVLLASGVVRTRDPRRRAALLVVGLLPPIWVGSYALQTAYFKPNNMLPITPILVLMVAATLTAAWGWLTRRWPRRHRTLMVGLAVVVLVWWWVRPGVLYAYRTVTPPTLQVLESRLARRGILGAGRLVLLEVASERERRDRAPRFSGRAVTGRVGNLARVSPDRRFASDALIFPAARLYGRSAAAYRALLSTALGGGLMRVDPSFGELRGPADFAILHPWRRTGVRSPLELEECGSRCHTAVLPPADDPREVGSLVIWLGRRPFDEVVPPRVVLEGSELRLRPSEIHRKACYFGTARFPLAEEPLRLRLDGAAAEGIAVALHRWLPPGEPVSSSRVAVRCSGDRPGALAWERRSR